MDIRAPAVFVSLVEGLDVPTTGLSASYHRVITGDPHAAQQHITLKWEDDLERVRQVVRAWCAGAPEKKSGDAVMRKSKFQLKDMAVVVGQPPRGGPVELTVFPKAGTSRLDAYSVISPIEAMTAARALAERLDSAAITAVLSLTRGWTPMAYIEMTGCSSASLNEVRAWVATERMKLVGEQSWESSDGSPFTKITDQTVRIGLHPQVDEETAR